MSAILIPRIQAGTVLRASSSRRTKPCLMLCTDAAGNTCEAIVSLAEQVLAAKRADPAADTHVFRLYALMPTEIALVKSGAAK